MKLLTKSVVLSPEDLHKDITKVLAEKIKAKYENSVTKDDGYIFKIADQLKIVSNHISSSMTSEIIFHVKFFAHILKPEVGNILDGKVIIVDERGVFVTIEDRMNVIVPATRLDGYVFVKSKNAFSDPQGNVIENGVFVKVEIIATRFEDKKFNCIGKIVN